MGEQGSGRWPALPLAAWQATYDTLHLYTQVVGKIRLALAPMTNQWWEVALYVTARGLTTSPIPYGDRIFQMDFDFHDHALIVSTGEGAVRRIPLGGSVQAFYRQVFATLQALDIFVKIRPMPAEVVRPIPLDHDTVHATYDPKYANRFWEVLYRVDTVLKQFRSRYTGKCSPVHFFWGSFDLTVSRFSGRRATPPASDVITRLAYNEEVSSVGFWPGGESPFGPTVPDAAFYSYFAPRPPGLENASVQPAAAFFHQGLGEHLLMYEDVRRSSDPEGDLLAFAQSVFDAGSRLAQWPDYTATWFRPEQEARVTQPDSPKAPAPAQ